MSISFYHSSDWTSAQNSLKYLSYRVNKSKHNELDVEMSCLPQPLRQKIFDHLRPLVSEPAKLTVNDAHLFVSKDQLLKAVEQTAFDMFACLNPEESKLENLNPYACLLKIYTLDEKTSSEELRAHLDLLPIRFQDKILQHTLNLSKENDILNSLPLVKQAIREISSEFLNLLPTSQRWIICNQRDKSPLSSYCTDKTQLELYALDHMNLLLSPPQDPHSFMEILKTRPDLWQNVPQFIFGLRIQDQDVLFDVAMLCAEHCPQKTAENIADFCIQDEKARVKIAKVCAERDPLMTASYIGKFKIQNEQDRIEIAKLCAERNGIGVAMSIKEFRVGNVQTRIEIAKLCAKRDGTTTAQFIDRFNIPVRYQADLLEIAKLCEEQSPYGTAVSIQNFKIQSEKDRIEIARVCARKHGSSLADSIAKFDIHDPDVLMELAELCMMQNAYTTAQKIQSFKIQSQADLVKLAKIGARYGAYGLAQFMQNFGIQSEQARIEIAKISAECDGRATAFYINNFNIQDNRALIEIAMLCAQQDGTGTAKNFSAFKIQDSQAIFLIGMSCLINSLGEAHENLVTHIPEVGDFKLLFEDFKNQVLSKELLINYLREFIVQHLGGEKSPFLNYLALFEAIQNPYVQSQVGFWLASILVFTAKLDPLQQEAFFKTGLIKAFSLIRSSALRLKLSPLLMEFAMSEHASNLFLDRLSAQDDGKTRILNMLLCSLEASGVPVITTDAVRDSLIPVFRGGDAEIRTLTEMLYHLHKSQSLLPNEKQWLLNELTIGNAKRGSQERKNVYENRLGQFRSKAKKSVMGLLTLLLFREEKQLVENIAGLKFRNPKLLPRDLVISPFLSTEEERTYLEEGMIIPGAKEVLQRQLSLTGGKDQIEKLYEKLMPERNSTALMIYAAKLSSLQEPRVMRDLGRYVNGVLTGTFSQDRYRVEHNPHLRQIANNHADILLKWQEALSVRNAKFKPETYEFKVQDWLHEKIIQDGHLEPTKTPHLLSLMDKLPVKEEDLSPIERLLRDLLSASSKEKQIEFLEQIRDELNKLPSCGFRANVDDQLKELNKKPSHLSQDVLVVDTDAYFDLLMSGTEVAQSCQHVNDAPVHNRGLLGYLLDGKNRMLVIKDNQGKIMARAKLSLLWDGKKPVLFLERLYTQGSYGKQCREAITEMAISKAQTLKLDLVVLKKSGYPEDKKDFDQDLQALENGVSYEYSDAMQGVQKNGTYTIPKTNLVLVKV